MAAFWTVIDDAEILLRYKLVLPPSNAGFLSPILLILPHQLSLSAGPHLLLKSKFCVCSHEVPERNVFQHEAISGW